MASFPGLGGAHAPYMQNSSRIARKPAEVIQFGGWGEQRYKTADVDRFEFDAVWSALDGFPASLIRSHFIDMKGRFRAFDMDVRVDQGGSMVTYANLYFADDVLRETETEKGFEIRIRMVQG